ncbi:MAG: T9SS type A sorting domain-containing protein [Ignavibacteriae bacterium]|nr:T9SS type A sorting domain-containing protein [Ignavibacteria bacterium]MBI3364400.1 T9SS type A sorting domain-containing protein [Ignavibacteriota bacterium]
MSTRSQILFLASMLMLLLLCEHAEAQWSADPTVNNPVSKIDGRHYSFATASDGQGGAIITWYDTRNGNADIYAQRVGANGSVLWDTGGVPVCTVLGTQAEPAIVSDGQGGAIIVWADFRKQHGLYAQRINANGVALWPAGGIRICTEPGGVKMISDGSGGAIIAWTDYPSQSNDGNIRAQKITGSGKLRWPAGGRRGFPVCYTKGDQSLLHIASDGRGGAIILWQDRRVYPFGMFAQHVSAAGRIKWLRNGKEITPNAVDGMEAPVATSMISDGAGGVFIAYGDIRPDGNVYAQRVNSSGDPQWQQTVCRAPRKQAVPFLTTDGQGDVIVAWFDERNHTNGNDIYAQRLNPDGVPQWTTDGVLVAGDTAEVTRRLSPIVSDGNGGAIVAWDQSGNIFAQRLDVQGNTRWISNGAAISSALGDQSQPQVISDNAGGAILCWYDSRNHPIYGDDIYAQRVDSAGAPGGFIVPSTRFEQRPLLEYRLNGNYPNPFNPTTTIEFELAQDALVTLKVYNTLGQEVATLIHNEVMDEGNQEVEFDASQLVSGVYYYTITAADLEGKSVLFSNSKKMLLVK